ncbi:unnamed protein product [Prorocentrum cordatum]|uniref:Uncharacterized protein n=1 Tax=Prorocentrum cordatum TaxID=2364126 RepID=A0ABN9VMR3_9DINO|nr:unnamed protein product [Polarella glacialis]
MRAAPAPPAGSPPASPRIRRRPVARAARPAAVAEERREEPAICLNPREHGRPDTVAPSVLTSRARGYAGAEELALELVPHCRPLREQLAPRGSLFSRSTPDHRRLA